ncbi:hypothetical protein RchiOBHm_Chr2g0095001 [Rosa chinensis]|uniref:Uncharacterized protein n=1 Tax=Rosa chinensis TaxID=74649 RepID=A0A2P6RKN9_ROSCH|nr:hypothetical protein RchiOBHm_Chr2g0095001 [Rosa chinensis]
MYLLFCQIILILQRNLITYSTLSSRSSLVQQSPRAHRNLYHAILPVLLSQTSGKIRRDFERKERSPI